MLPLHPNRTFLAVAAFALSALALSACDSVNLEGKVFDWMGISGSALDKKTRDPQMADRAPLVVPPGSVVVPGSRPARGRFATDHGISLHVPVIIKRRDEGTEARVALEEALR